MFVASTTKSLIKYALNGIGFRFNATLLGRLIMHVTFIVIQFLNHTIRETSQFIFIIYKLGGMANFPIFSLGKENNYKEVL